MTNFTADDPHGKPRPGNVKLAIWEILQKRVPSVGPASEEAFEQPLAAAGFGLDSVQLLDVLVAIETRFSVTFPEEWLFAADLTVAALASFVEKHGTVEDQP